MKRVIVFLIAAVSLIGCQKSTEELKSERNSLLKEVRVLQSERDWLMDQKDTAIQVIRLADATLGKTTCYLQLSIKQSTMTLDVGEHIKNKMNEVKFWIPVDYQTYREVQVGSELAKSTKVGSFLIDGDLSKLHIKVINKRVE